MPAEANVGMSLTRGRGTNSRVGAIEMGVSLVSEMTALTPGSIRSVNHQGPPALELRSVQGPTGYPMLMMSLPAEARDGSCQVEFDVTPTGVNLGETPVRMLFAWEVPALTAPDGTVISPADSMGVEVRVTAKQKAVVWVPPVSDWPILKATNHTATPGDPEFFDLASSTPPPIITTPGEVVRSWITVPELTWAEVPEALTWADADALWN